MDTPSRVIFDLNSYDGDWWKGICTEYQEQEEDYWMAFDPEEMDYHTARDIAEQDLGEEVSMLADYLDGSLDWTEGAAHACAGNRLLVRGTAGLWDGQRSGFTPYDDLKSALDTSPSRFGGRNIMADCEIDKIWEEDGSLLVTGCHHDGRTTIEIRQLTDAGEQALDAIEDAWVGEPFSSGGRAYDGSPESVASAMRDLWENPGLCPKLHYMELAFGRPAEEREMSAIDPLLENAEFTASSIMSAEVAAGAASATLHDVSGAPHEVPAGVLAELKDAVRISDRAATTTYLTTLTIAEWTRKGEASRESLEAVGEMAREASSAISASPSNEKVGQEVR